MYTFLKIPDKFSTETMQSDRNIEAHLFDPEKNRKKLQTTLD